MTETGNKITGSIIPLLFTVVGLFFLIKGTIPISIKWFREQALIEVQGVLTDAKLDWTPNGTGEFVYTITAEYAYQYKGKNYSLQMVETDVQDTSYHFVTEKYKQQSIEEQKANPEKVLYIDPETPEKYRKTDAVEAPFLILMVLLPCLFIFTGLFFIVNIFRHKKNITDPPSQPWLEKATWKNNHIACNTVSGSRGMIFMAIFWNLIAFPVFILFIKENGFQMPIIFFIGIFPLIGIGFTLSAVSKIHSRFKYGTSHLVLNPFPASIGGHFGGHIYFKKALPESSTIELKLSCIKVTYRGSGEDSSRNEELLWQNSGFAYLDNNQLKSAKFRLDIPADLNASGSSTEGIHWNMVSTVSCPNHHYSRLYEIPVFKTAEKSTISINSQEHPDAKNYAFQLINDVTEFIKKGEEYILTFPKFRMLRAPLFFAFLLGGGLLTLSINSFVEDYLPFLFSIGIGFFGVIFLGISITEGLYSLKVYLTPNKINVEHKWMGITLKTNHIAKKAIQEFTIDPYIRSTNNMGHHTAHYKISAVNHQGGKITVAIRLKHMATAEQMTDFFEKYFMLNKRDE